MLKYAALEKILGYTFINKDHLLVAMTHRSFLNEHREAKQDHNERYEFLGDAVLELVATDFLFRRFPTKPEGELTAVRSAIVNTVSLADASTKLGLGEYLLMSKGEAKDMGRARQYILANTFESLIGAMYLDQGMSASFDFIARNLFAQADEIVEKELWKDPKSRLQEFAQDKLGITPAYKTLSQKGPDHNRLFSMGVYFGADKVTEGEGYSKQEAEQSAAEKAIALRFAK